ncbi:helix-turn-helix domain-containing protein [Sorangium sp. So ce1014]|uniref:helix-turn-helix domain-containing protein n=1 Tax=Sorangium sp. So ce1014 TaxID=3133326 RepID=UPI003F5DC5E4
MRHTAQVARMLALAHHLQGAIDRGLLAAQRAVARKLGLTRARVTQLLDLLLLAPDLQDAVLALEPADGAEPMAERPLRAVAHAGTWAQQRAAWARRYPKSPWKFRPRRCLGESASVSSCGPMPARGLALPEDILTTRKVADHLKVIERTLYRLVQEGKLPAFKVGNSCPFRRENLERWISEQSRGTDMNHEDD